MEDLLKNNPSCGNMPGYVSLWAESVIKIQNIDYQNINTKIVTFAPGAMWGLIECRNISVDDNFIDGVHTIEINCDYNAVRNIMDYRLDRMRRNKFIVRLKDRNGQFWLAGTLEEPLNFDYEHLGEAPVSGVHLYHLRFYRQTTQPLSATL